MSSKSKTVDSSFKLSITDASVRYSEFSLHLDHFGLKEGEITALIGPSGAGKSTLLNCMAGLEALETGNIFLDGVDLTRSAAQKNIATVFQTPYLFKGSVGYNVGYGLRIRNIARSQIKQRVSKVLSLVGLAGWESRSILGLSGGEAQRVALARGLVLRPQIMMLDEPLSSLDEALRKSLSVEFSQILREQGVTVLYVTHSKQEAFSVSDKIAIMRAGQIVHYAKTDEILSGPLDKWTKTFLTPDDWWLQYSSTFKHPDKAAKTQHDADVTHHTIPSAS